MNFQRSRTPGAPRAAAAPQVRAERPVRRAVPQHLADHGPVGEADDVVEVLPGVLRVAAGVGPAEDGDGTLRPEEVGERVSEEGGLA